MKITVIYFSQSGNTKKVAEAMGSVFLEKGHTVEQILLREAKPDDASSCDLLGIGAPCFASQAPTPVRNFLRSLPKLENRAFVFATSGGGTGRVLYNMTRLLSERGADVVGGFLARGECFHPAPTILGRFPGRPDASDLDLAREFARSLSEHVSESRSGPLPGSRRDALKQGFGFYDFAAMINRDSLIRLLLPKPKLDPELCNGCERCVAECPTENISMQPLPVLGDNCIRCYRCQVVCPQKAFDITPWRFGNAIIWLFYNERFERWFGDVKPGEKCY